MDLDELQSVRDRERQTDKLQQLRESFYADAGELIQALRDQRERAAERADDPFDAPEVSRLSDEIDTAEQTVEAIYEKRVGKIVKAASFAAADLPAESDGMTAEETELFETLVDDIKRNRQHVLDVLAGEAGATASDDGADESAPVESTEESANPPTESGPAGDHTPEVIGEESVSAADVMGSGPDTGGSDAGPQDAGTTGTGAADTGGQSGSGSPDAGGRTDTNSPDASGGPDVDAPDASGKQPVPPEQEPPNAGGTASDSPSADGGAQVQTRRPDDAESHAGDEQACTTEMGAAGASGEAVEKTTASEDGETAGVARETVRITADVGDILGVDQREYDLSTDDVVRLPADNVNPLIERDAAERL